VEATVVSMAVEKVVVLVVAEAVEAAKLELTHLPVLLQQHQPKLAASKLPIYKNTLTLITLSFLVANKI